MTVRQVTVTSFLMLPRVEKKSFPSDVCQFEELMHQKQRSCMSEFSHRSLSVLEVYCSLALLSNAISLRLPAHSLQHPSHMASSRLSQRLCWLLFTCTFTLPALQLYHYFHLHLYLHHRLNPDREPVKHDARKRNYRLLAKNATLRRCIISSCGVLCTKSNLSLVIIDNYMQEYGTENRIPLIGAVHASASWPSSHENSCKTLFSRFAGWAEISKTTEKSKQFVKVDCQSFGACSGLKFSLIVCGTIGYW